MNTGLLNCARVWVLACRCLQDNQIGGDEYTAKMDEQMPEATILLFRRLAHAKVPPDGRCGMPCSTLCVSIFCWLHVEI